MVGGSNCESLTPTRGSDRHLPGNPRPKYVWNERASL